MGASLRARRRGVPERVCSEPGGGQRAGWPVAAPSLSLKIFSKCPYFRSILAGAGRKKTPPSPFRQFFWNYLNRPSEQIGVICGCLRIAVSELLAPYCVDVTIFHGCGGKPAVKKTPHESRIIPIRRPAAAGHDLRV